MASIIRSYNTLAMPQLVIGIFVKELEGKNYQIPVKFLIKEDIELIKKMFIDAAVIAQKAVFDGVELHTTHGFSAFHIFKS